MVPRSLEGITGSIGLLKRRPFFSPPHAFFRIDGPKPATVLTPLTNYVVSRQAICLFGVAVCFALLPMTRNSILMDGGRSSQEGLVRFLKRSMRISNPRVERALLSVDRKHFVEPHIPLYIVYQDVPLPIGYEETISAPHMHATCLDLLEAHISDRSRILDVGSGSGYLTATLAILGGPKSTVLGVEKHHELAERSILNIEKSNPELLTGASPRVRIRAGNVLSDILENEKGFDVIHVGAAASTLPQSLVDKLNPGGRMVIPVGPRSTYQELLCIDKDMNERVRIESLMNVRYVPLTRPSEGSGSISVN